MTESYQFGPFKLDGLSRLLLRDGKPVTLQPRAYEVLVYLVRHSDRLVTRDELMDAVWGLNVSEGVLNFQINQIRKALGDDASAPKYIQTFPKRGFRFIAGVLVLSGGKLEKEVETWRFKDESKVAGQGGEHISRNVQRERGEPKAHIDNDSIHTRLADEVADLSTDSAKLNLLFGGHFWHVAISCFLYASLYAVGLLVEIAYRWEVYGNTGWKVALSTFYWIFFTSIIGYTAAWKLTLSGRGSGLVLFSLIFICAAAILFVSVCLFLPATPITKARFQTYTAQAAYLKSISYFIVLAVLFMILPFSFVITLQRDLQSGNNEPVQQLLNGGKHSITPVGTIHIRLWVLTLLLATTGITALFLHHNLLENLVIDKYTNFFQILIYIRLLLYFTLGAECLTWYYWTLNEVKRECLVPGDVRSRASPF